MKTKIYNELNKLFRTDKKQFKRDFFDYEMGYYNTTYMSEYLLDEVLCIEDDSLLNEIHDICEEWCECRNLETC